MYVKKSLSSTLAALPARVLMTLGFTALTFSIVNSLAGSASAQPQVIRNITEPSQRLEMTVNTSRILTLDKRVPKMVVNNPELVSVTPISATQVQIAAKKPGVTQVNLWDEDGKVYTVDRMIYGDVRELEMALKRLFPESSIKVMRLTNSLVLEGFIERPEAVGPVIRLAEDYAPKIVNNITVGGVQQILLKVKVMEVSRTKLRSLGVDWQQASGGNLIRSSVASVSGLAETFRFGVVDGGDSFLAVLEALQQNNAAKVLANPAITAISGRPAKFLVGGELPIPVPSGLNQITIEYKKFGTQLDFLPIALGNGNVRLEVRSEVSEVDDTRSVVISGITVPAIKTSFVDTGVEMKAGQTLVLAGLIQTRIDTIERGLPFLSDLPYIGAAFRSVKEDVSEVELLVMVTPEFAAGMDPHEVPQCGPGMETVSPTNNQLYWGGHLEVPSVSACGPNGCGPASYNSGCQSCGVSGAAYVSDGSAGNAITLPVAMPVESVQMQPQANYNFIDTGIGTATESINTPTPSLELSPQMPPAMQPGQPAVAPNPDPAAYRPKASRTWNQARNGLQAPQGRPSNPYAPATAQRPKVGTSTPGLMGPIGYDVK